jgi:hypothetical protein
LNDCRRPESAWRRESLTRSNLEALVKAKIEAAKGKSFLVICDKRNRKFLRVAGTNTKLAKHEELLEVWERDPDVQAYTELMDFALGEPVVMERSNSSPKG